MPAVAINLRRSLESDIRFSSLWFPRVPVVGDIISHESIEYSVTAVVLYTEEHAKPFVEARSKGYVERPQV